MLWGKQPDFLQSLIRNNNDDSSRRLVSLSHRSAWLAGLKIDKTTARFPRPMPYFIRSGDVPWPGALHSKLKLKNSKMHFKSTKNSSTAVGQARRWCCDVNVTLGKFCGHNNDQLRHWTLDYRWPRHFRHGLLPVLPPGDLFWLEGCRLTLNLASGAATPPLSEHKHKNCTC